MSFWGVTWGDSWGTAWGPLHTVEERPWDTAQGIAKNAVRFTPIRDAEVFASSCGATASTTPPTVESSGTTTIAVRGAGAEANEGVVFVQASATVPAASHNVLAGSGRATAQTGVSLRTVGHGARCGGSMPLVDGGAEVAARAGFVLAGSRKVLACDTVRNPTDEELVLWFLHHRGIDTLTSKQYKPNVWRA